MIHWPGFMSSSCVFWSGPVTGGRAELSSLTAQISSFPLCDVSTPVFSVSTALSKQKLGAREATVRHLRSKINVQIISPFWYLVHIDAGRTRWCSPCVLWPLCWALRRGLWSGASSNVRERMTVSHRNWAPLISSSLSSSWVAGSSSSLCCLSFTAKRKNNLNEKNYTDIFLSFFLPKTV